MAGPGLISRIDAAIAELQAIRAELAGAEAGGEKGLSIVETPAADLTGGDLIDTHSAASRFGYPQDSIRKWCREENLGVRRGGRWLVDPRKLRARLNGG
jgi:hypothetical protein